MQGKFRDPVPNGYCGTFGIPVLTERFKGRVGHASDVTIEINVVHYPVKAGPFTVSPDGPAHVVISRGSRQKWTGLSGQLAVNADLFSGTIDANLISSTDKNSTLHVSGDWVCSG
jgi:hypothetical protein